MKKRIVRGILIFLAIASAPSLASSLLATPREAGNKYHLDITISGTLLATRACYLDPGTSAIELNFDGIVNKELYANKRTRGKEFTIRLLNCDTALGHEAVLTFNGAESTISGFLAPDDNDPASGLAIGLESRDGVQVPFNNPVSLMNIIDGDNHITLMSFIQVEPDAANAHSVRLGAFTASATFTISYL